MGRPDGQRVRARARSLEPRALVSVASLLATTALACSGTDAPNRGPVADVVALASALPASLPELPEIALPSGDPALSAPIELKKVRADEEPLAPWAPSNPEYAYVLDTDHGIRADAGGKGWFLAPRAHGKHNGVDFLAEVGASLLSACNGKARSDERGGYGRVVQVVCKLPHDLGGSEGLHASFFYAHLERVSVPGRWVPIKAGSKVGTVGKTGNASGRKVKPHLHLEVIVRESEKDAMSETHSGVVPEAEEAADRFFELLEERCLAPARLSSNADIRRERRVDPFVLLTCAAKPKPELTVPSRSELRAAQVPWREHYSARTFDVDRGPRP